MRPDLEKEATHRPKIFSFSSWFTPEKILTNWLCLSRSLSLSLDPEISLPLSKYFRGFWGHGPCPSPCTIFLNFKFFSIVEELLFCSQPNPVILLLYLAVLDHCMRQKYNKKVGKIKMWLVERRGGDSKGVSRRWTWIWQK